MSDRLEASYDRLVQQWIPGYASLARLGVCLMASSPLGSGQGASVLVAGCGTGAELLEARAQRPDWKLTAIDPSAEMLAVAQARLQGRGPIDWRCSNVEDLGADGCFAGALAVLVLQSLPDDGSKLEFLSALARGLLPEGQLVLVDLMRSERSALQGQIVRAREAFHRAGNQEDGLPVADPDLIQALTQGLHPIGIARLTALAEAAGFTDPAPVFRALDVEGFLLQRRS